MEAEGTVYYQSELPVDAATAAMRGIFEMIAFEAMRWAPAMAATYAAWWASTSFAPSIGQWAAAVGGAAWYLVLLGISRSFDGEDGNHRKEAWMQVARRYAFPIVLLLGVLGGYYVRDFLPPSDQDAMSARRAALSACASLPVCVNLAERNNGGNDVLWVMRQY